MTRTSVDWALLSFQRGPTDPCIIAYYICSVTDVSQLSSLPPPSGSTTSRWPPCQRWRSRESILLSPHAQRDLSECLPFSSKPRRRWQLRFQSRQHLIQEACLLLH